MSNNMHNLTTLIKRLEAATSRLEDMAQSTIDPSSMTNGLPPASGVTGTTAKNSGATTPRPHAEPLPASIDDFDGLINGDVKTFANMSLELGGLVAEQSAGVLRAFAAEREFLMVTTRAKKPDKQSTAYMEILKELQSTMGAVGDIREANRGSPFTNHLTTVSEGIAMLGWITIEPRPAEYVSETLGAAQYYGNRVLKEFKDKEHAHVQWVQCFYRIFRTLVSYIKNHYPAGITWNSRDGIDPIEALHQIQSGLASATSPRSQSQAAPGPPPPPPLPKFNDPPPQPPMPMNGTSWSRGASSDMGAVFEQLSQGEAVTSGLRKVDPSSQTHKNPSLRASSAVPAAPTRSDSQTSLSSRGKSPIPGKKPKPESMRTRKPPRKELDGNKWIIENYESPSEGMIEVEASINQSILISRCTKVGIRVVNKGNAISVDNCTNLSLVIDSLVSSVDVIKSPKFEMQVLGTLPTIMLDQVDGASIYLGKESLGTEVFTSKCASVNINVFGDSEDDDYRECPLPEQVKSVVRNGRVVSEIVDHAG